MVLRRRVGILFLGAFLSLIAGGCATEEALPAADRDVPAAFRNASMDPLLPGPRALWWQEFSSPELDRLQEAALSHNRELRAAVARVAQAQAQAEAADAGRAATVDAFARRENSAPFNGPGSANTPAEWHIRKRYQIGLRLNYEIDAWGRLGFGAASALALAQASEHDREAIGLTLTADVATAYFEYLALGERIGIAQRGVESRAAALASMEARLRGGDATSQEVAQFRVSLKNAEASMHGLVQRRDRVFNRLALLIGTSPATLSVEAHALDRVAIPSVDSGLPGELLCRRPDVRRAEAQLASAAFDVQAVRASLMPTIALNAEGGLGVGVLPALGSPSSLFFLLAANAVKSVLDGGRREAQLKGSRARHLELLEHYSGTLLTAISEVEDALVNIRLTSAQHAALEQAATAARANFFRNRRAYEVGGIDTFAYRDLEQRAIDSEDPVASMRHDRLRAAVDLYKALGGGQRTGVEACPE